MLTASEMNVFYGRIQALWDVSFDVNESEIVALIGANGAGKTTLLNSISGFLPTASGKLEFLGKSINGLKSHDIVEMGMSHIPEGRRLFPDMSVYENLEMGAYTKRAWKDRQKNIEKIYALFPILKARSRQSSSTLSGGEQQMLAMGRGLMSNPRLCIIDEPSSGLAPMIVEELFDIFEGLRNQGISIFLVEQNVQQTLEISDRAYVLENGRIVLKGDSKELLKTDLIRKAYLGL